LAKKKTQQKSKGARRGGNRNLMFGVGAVALAGIVVAAFVLATQGGGGNSKPSVRGAASLTPVVFTGQEASVKVIDKDYSPRAIRVPVGATVTWEFSGSLPHNVTDESSPKSFDSGTKQQGETFAHTFSSPGQFDYYCTIHHVMTGTVFVGP
jgi:plastocyanin